MKKFNRILLIDDDATYNFITKVLLTRISFAEEIIDFSDAYMAINHLRETTLNGGSPLPDLIFLDLDMPGMDGWDFLEEYQQLPSYFVKDCRLYILSSSIDPNDKSKSMNYSCVSEFITKPLLFDKAQLIRENN